MTEHLSPTERRVVIELALHPEDTVVQLGRRIGMPSNTVRTHLDRAKLKLRVRRATSLVAWAWRTQISSWPAPSTTSNADEPTYAVWAVSE